jgi:hypothetical protein
MVELRLHAATIGPAERSVYRLAVSTERQYGEVANPLGVIRVGVRCGNRWRRRDPKGDRAGGRGFASAERIFRYR